MAWPGTDPLAFYRGLIDEVDGQLGDLLARRAALTRAAQAHKDDGDRGDRGRHHGQSQITPVRSRPLRRRGSR